MIFPMLEVVKLWGCRVYVCVPHEFCMGQAQAITEGGEVLFVIFQCFLLRGAVVIFALVAFFSFCCCADRLM